MCQILYGLIWKCGVSALKASICWNADIEKSLRWCEMCFLLCWRQTGSWETSLLCLFFHGGGGWCHAGLASTMWKGRSQELCRVLLWECGVVVLGCVAVRWLAIVTSFVVGISCRSVIVGQIEVINHPHPLNCGMIIAPKAPESWTSAHCLPPPPPSSILSLVSVYSSFLKVSWLLLSSSSKP